MANYGYRSITTRLPRVAGTVQRGNLARGQRKGDRFVLDSPANVILNIRDGNITSVTVLHEAGSTRARLDPNAFL